MVKPLPIPSDNPDMTTIKASCPTCGEVDLSAEEILLRIATAQRASSYGFSCPTCSDFVEKAADDRVVKLLLSGGVIPLMVNVPAEALEIHDGPAFTYDDALAFHEVLQGDEWFEALTKQLGF
jgi:hypothetical protein